MSVFEDPEALREEGQVPVWRRKLWSACYPSQDHPSPEEEVNALPRHPPPTPAPPLPVSLHGVTSNYHKVKIQGISSPTFIAYSPTPLTALFFMCMCTYICCDCFFFLSFCLLAGILILTEHSVISLPMPFDVL